MKLQSAHANGEDIEILGNVVQYSGEQSQKVSSWVGSTHTALCSFSKVCICCCQYMCRGTECQIYKFLVFLVSLYGYETWTLNVGLEKTIDSCVHNNLCRINKYCQSDCQSSSQCIRLSWDALLAQSGLQALVLRPCGILSRYHPACSGGQECTHKSYCWNTLLDPAKSY